MSPFLPNAFRGNKRTHRASRVMGQVPEALERRVLLSVVYVDDTAPGPARDGATWATAYTGLQEALDAAAASPGADEIRVAAGTYRPTDRAEATDPRSATFKLANEVAVLGGFPDGGGATRDVAANLTRLRGRQRLPCHHRHRCRLHRLPRRPDRHRRERLAGLNRPVRVNGRRNLSRILLPQPHAVHLP